MACVGPQSSRAVLKSMGYSIRTSEWRLTVSRPPPLPRRGVAVGQSSPLPPPSPSRIAVVATAVPYL